MSESKATPPSPARLRRLIAAYEQRRSAGRPVDEADILRSYPDLADGFRRYMARRSSAKPPYASTETSAANMGRPGKATGSSWDDDLAATLDATDADEARTDLLPLGTLIDRYEITEVLGTGSMGIVYRATDQRLGREVALKVPDIRGQHREMFLQRFESEARVAAALSHPSLCPILDFGSHDQQPFLTMPLLPGPSLAQFVELEGAQSPADVVQLVRPIVEGLREMHDNGVTHRDLKPSNVLLNRRGRPVITDFGLARRDELSADVRLTNASALLGSPAYCSPEQVRGDRGIGPTSDLYSLGVLMYELLTGRLPFEGSVGEVLGAVLHVSPAPPSQLRPSLPQSLEKLCLSLLHKDPAGRPQSAAKVLQRLDDPTLTDGPPGNGGWLATIRRAWRRRAKHSTVAVLTAASITGGVAVLLGVVATGKRKLPAFDYDAGVVLAPAEPRRPAPDRAANGVTPDVAASIDGRSKQTSSSGPWAARGSLPKSQHVQPAPALITTSDAAADAAAEDGLPPIEPMARVASASAGSFWPFLSSVLPGDPAYAPRRQPTKSALPGHPSASLPPQPLIRASSWLSATGRQDLTTWVAMPSSPRWQIEPEAAALVSFRSLEDTEGKQLRGQSDASWISLWHPQPLGNFDFEMDVSGLTEARVELVFRALAPGVEFIDDAVHIPLQELLLEAAATGKSEVRGSENDEPCQVYRLSGSVRRNELELVIDSKHVVQRVFDPRESPSKPDEVHWHTVARPLPFPGYFGIRVAGSEMRIARTRVQPHQPGDAAGPGIALPRPELIAAARVPMGGSVARMADKRWLRIANTKLGAPLLPAAAESFSLPISSLSGAVRHGQWSRQSVAEALAEPNPLSLVILGGVGDARGERLALFGSHWIVSGALDHPQRPLRVDYPSRWQHVIRVFPLEGGRFLGFHTPARSKKHQVSLWELPAKGAPVSLGVAQVPKHVDTVAATPDGDRLVYTASGRLFDLRRNGNYHVQHVQRISWNPLWSALSPDGQRLAVVVGPPGIWTAKLMVLRRDGQRWKSDYQYPLSRIFWQEPPAITQRQFANFRISPRCMQWSPDGKNLLATFARTMVDTAPVTWGTAMVWGDGGRRPLLRMPEVSLDAAAFAEDSQSILLSHRDEVARLWNLPAS